ncbi:unnamed protein product [Darwinula stevensoni]|uniref:DUF7619 domain-containing protein n=1 Tax=Darwinula stevensoni TaxID=69355 RepID=A0A7R9FQ53_9CRUS|nr:unnamed protein product [Darwinula stevensoni]CAG0898805.1 unnamed protein product [Darwinula stevensoni]
MPAVNAGDKLYLTASILDNIFTLENTVVGSYDPNDKTCLQGDRVKPDMVGEYVDYLIRFENTGNYAAENVVVKDIIDTKTFDVSTLKITDSSHEVYTRIEGNKVEFIFENIQLPFEDANNDGYIAFKIKTLPTLVLGDSLKNLADIYFDYNFPIRTNEAQTTVAFPVFTKDITTEVNIYPNPVTEILYLDKNDHWTKAEIYDIAGRIMRSASLEGDRVKPDMVGEYVDYLIRFENTGNYAAENVVVKDIIDTKTFDVSTLKITDASHEVYTRIEDNKVEFIFENIQLPFDDANNDGYIAFKIKTLPTLIIDFPDANFKNALVNSKCADTDGDNIFDADVDFNADGEIDVDEALRVTNKIPEKALEIILHGGDNSYGVAYGNVANDYLYDLANEGGESQRTRLASQIGSQLTGITYIMDEPSIGLHQRDNHKLIKALRDLTEIGNSVLVVEHDKDIMLASDYIIDLGPGAGMHGGEIVTMDKLVEKGNTVIIIEHNMDVIKVSDYVVDLGPEGGKAGGIIQFAGTPEAMIKKSNGHTAEYLKKEM